MACADPVIDVRKCTSGRTQRLWLVVTAVAILVTGTAAWCVVRLDRARVPVQSYFDLALERMILDQTVPRTIGDNSGVKPGIQMPAIVLGLALAAGSIWLTARIINSRRRLGARSWAAIALGIFLAYPVSFGPACWFDDGTKLIPVSTLYYPIVWLGNRASHVGTAVLWYADLGMSDGWTHTLIGDELSCWGPVNWPSYQVTSCYFALEADDSRKSEDGPPQVDAEAETDKLGESVN